MCMLTFITFHDAKRWKILNVHMLITCSAYCSVCPVLYYGFLLPFICFVNSNSHTEDHWNHFGISIWKPQTSTDWMFLSIFKTENHRDLELLPMPLCPWEDYTAYWLWTNFRLSYSIWLWTNLRLSYSIFKTHQNSFIFQPCVLETSDDLGLKNFICADQIYVMDCKYA